MFERIKCNLANKLSPERRNEVKVMFIKEDEERHQTPNLSFNFS